MEAKKSFIVVDDDPVNNFISKLAIQKYDGQAEIKLYTEPEAALAAIKATYSNTPEKGATVLFLDINMPTMTGWEFLSVFQEYGKDVLKQFTIYILSSSVEHRDLGKAESNTLVSGFLSKPLSEAKIDHLFS